MTKFEVSRPRRRKAFGAFVGLAGLAAAAGSALAEDASPFARYYGEWRGTGFIANAQGDRAAISCTAVCTEGEGGKAMQQSLSCESPRAKFHAENYIVANGNEIVGNWQELTNQVTGRLTGRIQGQLFVGRLDAPAVTASVWMRADKRSQTIRIEPQGQKVTRIEIVMKAVR